MSEADTRARIPQFDLPDRLRKSLEHADIEVENMAQWLEVHPNTIRNWIAGRTRPRTSDLKQWSVRAEIPYEWIAHGIVPDPARSAPQRSHSGADLPPSTADLRSLARPLPESTTEQMRAALRARIPTSRALTGQGRR